MPPNSANGWESETRTPRRTDLFMQITVQGYLTFKELVGKCQIFMPAASTLRDLLDSLQDDLGERFKQAAYAGHQELAGQFVVLLNGRHSTHLPDGVNTVLQDGDVVAIFPPIAGG